MKSLLFISTLFLTGIGALAQTNKIDSLIKKVDNGQLEGVCHYFWILEMPSKAGQELVIIGKPATNKLLNILTDSNNGIIAHYILTNIWIDSAQQWSSLENYNKDSSVLYNYNGLAFYERLGHWHTSQKDLMANKIQWLNFLNRKSNR